MSAIIRTNQSTVAPVCRTPISIRVATLSDIPFFDRMQKQFGKQLGYFRTKQFEGYVEMGAVLVAEEARDSGLGTRDSGEFDSSAPESRIPNPESRLGYVISRDRYLKRDELGVIYQLCVAPGTQRKLVGATLVHEVFARSAYGCKLYCCWCAQDIDANYFWESLGFVPIAFRAGSAKKKRVHIFWQRRINDGDETTPFWYPSNTTGGALAQDRLVFPIPRGVHWKDVKAIVLPGSAEAAVTQKKLPKPKGAKKKAEAVLPTGEIRSGGLRMGPVVVESSLPVLKEPLEEARERKPKAKCDPALAAKARELRDRWMERVNANPAMLVGTGKYEVNRRLPAAGARDVKMLDAA